MRNTIYIREKYDQQKSENTCQKDSKKYKCATTEMQIEMMKGGVGVNREWETT